MSYIYIYIYLYVYIYTYVHIDVNVYVHTYKCTNLDLLHVLPRLRERVAADTGGLKSAAFVCTTISISISVYNYI